MVMPSMAWLTSNMSCGAWEAVGRGLRAERRRRARFPPNGAVRQGGFGECAVADIHAWRGTDLAVRRLGGAAIVLGRHVVKLRGLASPAVERVVGNVSRAHTLEFRYLPNAVGRLVMARPVCKL